MVPRFYTQRERTFTAGNGMTFHDLMKDLNVVLQLQFSSKVAVLGKSCLRLWKYLVLCAIFTESQSPSAVKIYHVDHITSYLVNFYLRALDKIPGVSKHQKPQSRLDGSSEQR